MPPAQFPGFSALVQAAGPKWRWGVTAAYIALLLTVCLMPAPSTGREGFPHADKIVHSLFWGCLALLLLWTYYLYPIGFKRRLVLTWCTAFLVGIVIEGLQSAVPTGRHFSGLDLVADAAGVAVFSVGVILFRKACPSKSK